MDPGESWFGEHKASVFCALQKSNGSCADSTNSVGRAFPNDDFRDSWSLLTVIGPRTP